MILACGVVKAQDDQAVTAVFSMQKEIQLPEVSIMPFDFSVFTLQDQPIDESQYQVDYQNAVIKFSDEVVKNTNRSRSAISAIRIF